MGIDGERGRGGGGVPAGPTSIGEATLPPSQTESCVSVSECSRDKAHVCDMGVCVNVHA